MNHRKIVGLIVFLLISGFLHSSYAEDQETIELTTYYPAPYGEYDVLKADTLEVGSSNSAAADSGLIKLKIYDDTAGAPSGSEGFIYYSEQDKEIKYHDGTGWQAVGGLGAGTITFDTDAVSVPNNPITTYRATETVTDITIDFTGKARGAILNFEKINPVGGADWGDVIIDLFRADGEGAKIGRILAQAAGDNPADVRNMGAFAIVPLVNGQVRAQRIQSEHNMNVDVNMNVYVVALIE